MSSSVVDLRQHRGELRPLHAVRLLDQLRERIRYLHYSRRTEDIDAYGCRAFNRCHGLRHPRVVGGTEVEAFLAWLADERQAASATHEQALSARLLHGTGMRINEALQLRVKVWTSPTQR